FRHRRYTSRNLLWLLAFLGSLALLIHAYAKCVGFYFQYPHSTQLEEETARNKTFPAVTLCNLNPARFSQLSGHDLYWAGEMLGLLDGAGQPLVPESPEKSRLEALLGTLAMSEEEKSRPFDLEDFFHRLGHQIEDMLVECRFQGERCGPQHFAPVYTRYGKCYTFNGDRRNPRVTRQGGMGNGLEIMLDIQQEEYLPIWRETNETSFEAGIRVQIHSQDEPPYIHQLGFGVSPGFQTFVSCQEQRVRQDAPQPLGRCPWAPSPARPCSDAPLALADSQERCSCPTPCNLTRYGKEISMVRIPNKGSARYLARKYNKNETYIRENFLVLDIFFEALNYEAIEQKKAYDIAGLLGDIGGQMGLFIGASILTILEILDYVYESPCETLGRHVEGTYNAGILPNHHHRHHYPHQGVFEDFAC
uniref:Acid sensing ion channel subunit family member 4 n=1 Tax=Buteo japonicus TaxID=224669 RepID=A0A8C0BHT7_9AVES